MAAKIKIKRSANTQAPTTLAQGELAYSYKTGVNKLYLGTGTETNGNAANHDVIGGKYYTDLLTVTAGTTTGEKALIPDANKKLDTLKLGHITISLNDIVVDDGTTSDLDIDLGKVKAKKRAIEESNKAINLIQKFKQESENLVSLAKYTVNRNK